MKSVTKYIIGGILNLFILETINANETNSFEPLLQKCSSRSGLQVFLEVIQDLDSDNPKTCLSDESWQMMLGIRLDQFYMNQESSDQYYRQQHKKQLDTGNRSIEIRQSRLTEIAPESPVKSTVDGIDTLRNYQTIGINR